MTDSGDTYPPPAADAAAAPAFVPPGFVRPGRRPMVLRHLLSVGIALVLTPVGLVFFDYGANRYSRRIAYLGGDRLESLGDMAIVLVGGLVLVVVAAIGRLSGLGPVLAGLIWGLIPLLWFVIDIGSFFQFSQDLPTTTFWFASPVYLFGLVTVMLLGAGVAGRWRGARW